MARKATPESEAAPARLVQAARAYARAYDRLERNSRGPEMGSADLFARFQEAQVELNLAALDSFAAKVGGSGRRGKEVPKPAARPAKRRPPQG